jgi:hypothetical protein
MILRVDPIKNLKLSILNPQVTTKALTLREEFSKADEGKLIDTSRLITDNAVQNANGNML